MPAPSAPTIGSPLLVPFDGSANAEAVFPFVPLLADGKREVVLLQVIPEAQAVHSPLGKEMLTAEELQRLSDAAARADLDRAARALRSMAPDLRLEQVIEVGEPAERIAAVATERQVRTVLLSSQGHSSTRPGGFGSVVGYVVRLSPVPVVVVRSPADGQESAGVERLVVAHDGSARAARVIPLVHDLARRLSAHVHLIAVIEHEESELPPAVAATIDPHLRDQAQADALNRARRCLEAAGAQFLRQGLPASWHVHAGPAAPTIIAACSPRDVLVITSHGQTASRWMLGSVAEKLIREAPVPVILLRTPPTPDESAAT